MEKHKKKKNMKNMYFIVLASITIISSLALHGAEQKQQACIQEQSELNCKNLFSSEQTLFQSAIDQGCDVNMKSLRRIFWGVDNWAMYDDQVSPLQWATSFASLKNMRVLLQDDAHINAQSGILGATALIFAIVSPRANAEMVKLLLSYGADPRIADNKGHDAFWHAEYQKNHTSGEPAQKKLETLEQHQKAQKEIRVAAMTSEKLYLPYQPSTGEPVKIPGSTGLRALIGEYAGTGSELEPGAGYQPLPGLPAGHIGAGAAAAAVSEPEAKE